MRKLLLILLVLISVSIVACGGDEKVALPEIPEEAINMAVDQIKQEEIVKDAAVVVKGNGISLAVVVYYATNEITARQIGENFVRLLGSMTASLSEELNGPSKDHLGDLYNHYDLLITVASNSNKIIVQGAKIRGGSDISW